jgi:membrane protein implicated in regulation of membrane protease activity
VYNLQNSRPPSGSVMGENIQAGVSLFGGAAGGLTLTVGSIGLVTMFGAASTGTAISALSGAAATNALLAWFGGGALVMGGAGMAGGAAILVGIAVVPGVAIATYLTYRQSKKVEQRIELYEAATIEVHANYNRAISLFELVQSVIVKLEDMSSNFDELCFLEKNWMNSDIKFFSFKFTFQLRKKVRIETIEKAGIFLTKFNKEISQLCLSS